MSLKQNEHFEETKLEAELEKQTDPNCKCDCHKIIDRDRFYGNHKCD